MAGVPLRRSKQLELKLLVIVIIIYINAKSDETVVNLASAVSCTKLVITRTDHAIR
jgi:hypothetical protein